MKIGIVCPYNINRHGGVLEVILALQEGLKKRGHTVKIITPRPRGEEQEENEDIIFLGTSADFRSPAATTTQVSSSDDNEKIDALLEEEKFDILHFHEPWSPLLSRQLLQRSQSVNIATFHSKVPEAVMTRTVIKVVTPYLKSVMSYLDELTAVSPSGADYASTLTEQSITIIPNGIDLNKYKAKAAKPKTKAAGRTLLYVGRLEGRKGVKYLLRAFKLYAEKHPKDKLVIVGDGPDREKLGLMAEDLEINNVSFLGFVPEEKKLQLFAEADLFVSPALFGESFGIVLLEAMAMNVVTVAGANSGYIDLMQGPGALSIVNPEDTEEFARRLELLTYEESVRKVWQDWAKDYVRQFDYPKVVMQYEAFYKKALKQHHEETKRPAA